MSTYNAIFACQSSRSHADYMELVEEANHGESKQQTNGSRDETERDQTACDRRRWSLCDHRAIHALKNLGAGA